MRHKGHNFGGWIDRKLFYDKEDLVRLANHWLLGTYEIKEVMTHEKICN